MQPKLSIVIPTKNRQKYCIETIKQIYSLGLINIQIVIQDNSDNNSLIDFVDTIQKEIVELKYNYHSGVLSFVDNFSEAVSIADGEYICMIGDDDGILPNILKIVDYAKENELDAVIPDLNSVYFWPAKNPIIKNGENGYLCVSYLNNAIKDVDCKDALLKLMYSGGQNYQSFDLPRLYHGIVKKSILEKIKKQTGVYFAGLTPDIYMSVVLSFVCQKVVRLDYPVTISGICAKSGSADSATGRHTGELKDAPHFRGHTSYDWDCKAPKIYSVESIWAETVMKALHAFQAEDLYNRFRVDILDSICLKNYPQFSDIINKHAKDFGYSVVQLKLNGLFITIRNFFNRALRFLKRKPGDVNKFYNVENINKAVEITNNELKDRGIVSD